MKIDNEIFNDLTGINLLHESLEDIHEEDIPIILDEIIKKLTAALEISV